MSSGYKQIDRNGKKITSKTGQDKLLHILYATTAGRMLLKPLVCPQFSKLAGKVLNTRLSRCLIRPFVSSNRINMNDFRNTSYSSYNDFFTRKIKPGARTICGTEQTLISPCDCYATAYPITSDRVFHVKNARYTVASLLRSRKLAAQFEGGYALILRLTVCDYHRYCYAVTGKQSKIYRIPGILHTVNPVAGDYFPIYKENAREYTVIRSPEFGDVVQMEVGALMVGKIVNHKQRCPVRRGEEKGYFEFGGSTIILLLRKDAVILRSDLLRHTADGYETQVRLGDALGEAAYRKPGTAVSEKDKLNS